MPRLIQPPAMPQEVEAIIETIGNRARAQVLHELATQGQATAPELAHHLGSNRATTGAHLKALEAAGLVRADIPEGQRQGRAVRWTIDAERVDHYLRELGNYLTGH